VELSRKFSITSVLFFFMPGTVLQIIAAMFTGVLYLGIHSKTLPYKVYVCVRKKGFHLVFRVVITRALSYPLFTGGVGSKAGCSGAYATSTDLILWAAD
jgi:hypothetical protein